MKFISNSWSPNMVSFPDWEMSCHKLSEEEFHALSYDAFSCINQQNLANILNVAFNPEPINLRAGDVLLVAHLKGGKLPPHADDLPKNVVLEFYCYQIMESSTPMIREGIKMEE